MKHLLAGLVIGLTLGGGSALAATSNYWAESGRTYSCEGTALYVRCTDEVWLSGYRFLFSPGWVDLYEGKRPIFQCPRKLHAFRCTDLR